MAAVTQAIPNFLGGVSRQNDDKKLLNQVTECVNGYPDATYGMLKRPGMEHINVLKKANGTAFTKSELDGAAWFFIDRDDAGSYVGAIKGSNIYVWTKDEGTWCTINNLGTNYLTGTSPSDYHFRSVQDTTIITNKTYTTEAQATPVSGTDFIPNSIGTVKLNTLTADLDYSVTIQGVESKVTAQNSTTFDDFLIYDSGSTSTNHHLIDAIHATITAQHTAGNSAFAGKWYLEAYTNSIVIKRASGSNAIITDYTQPAATAGVAFTLEAKGGPGNIGIESFLDSVTDTSSLPAESFGGHHVTVLNTASDEDDYYLKFVATNTTTNRGKGYYQETRARDVSPGLNALSMPHQLENTGSHSFTLKPLVWVDRNTGDSNSNPDPSFVGHKINATFFYNDRLGVLSEDNVFLGVANDPFNFFTKSALVQVDSDPIDLNVASIRPVLLTDVVPSPQGLLIFSSRQQFQLYASSSSTLTPTTSVIRSLSNYEMSSNIKPVEVGTSVVFVNTVPGASKLFTMQLGEIEQNPTVIDISKVVFEWIPDTVDDLTASAQNSAVILIDRESSYLYLYRYYNNGEQDLFQAWTKWQLPGTIQSSSIIDDDLMVVSQHEDEYTLGKITLDQIPTGEVVAKASTTDGNPCLDMFARPVNIGAVDTISISAGGAGYSDATNVNVTGGSGSALTVDITTISGTVTGVTLKTRGKGYNNGDTVYITGGNGNAACTVTTAPVIYDETNDVTLIYSPYTPMADKKAVMFLTVPVADVGTSSVIDADAGYYAEALERTENLTNNNYFEVKGKFTDYADGIVIGYNYDFEVTLPKLYYRINQAVADFTASLTISRVKFSVGNTGAVQFKLKADGSNEWKPVEHTADADYYAADSNPVKNERQFAVPIHQRNTNFELKVTSNFPYPVSLVSMMWEGNYSPRFYRRK